jgi:RimJ/RimL family protein N-acetyltransferase
LRKLAAGRGIQRFYNVPDQDNLAAINLMRRAGAVPASVLRNDCYCLPVQGSEGPLTPEQLQRELSALKLCGSPSAAKTP